jgi:hypothetical protein
MTERLEADLEPRTQRLIQEAQSEKSSQRVLIKALGITLAMLALIYSGLWYAQAAYINTTIETVRTNMAENSRIADSSSLSDIHSFPGKPGLTFQGVAQLDNGMRVTIPALEISAWAFTANMPIRLSAPQGLQLRTPAGRKAVTLDRMHFDIIIPAKLPQRFTKAGMKRWHESGEALRLRDILIAAGDISVRGRADIHVDREQQPEIGAELRLSGVKALLRRIEQQNIASRRSLVIAEGILNSLRAKGKDGQPGAVKLPLRVQDRRLYVSGLPVARVPPVAWKAHPDRPQ